MTGAPESGREQAAGIDPDIDLGSPAQDAETSPREWDLLVAIGVGGAIGSEARYGLGELMPHIGTGFPASTLVINISGSLLLGVLMAILLNIDRPHRLARPFFGVGIIGGYTTFSTFSVDTVRLLNVDKPLTAVSYVLATVVTCAVAVWIATGATRRILGATSSRR